MPGRLPVRIRMVTPGQMLQNTRARISEEWFVFRLTLHSLFFNSFTSWNTILETLLEPMFWFVDHFVRYLGPIFVFMVIVLTTSVVVIFYICLLPEKMADSYAWTCYHLVVGHWLLGNVVFHYFKAAFTCPGYVPPKIPEVSGVCKKCISPKSPRSHHCSICDRCVLKMDHHCPWVNNCIGHYNHRYFFLYCTYMCAGCYYVCISAYPVFVQHLYGNLDEDEGWPGLLQPFYLIKKRLSMAFVLSQETKTQADLVGPVTSVMLPTRPISGLYVHTLVMYEFLLCSAAALALTALLVWHLRLILCAETSIEMHTNRVETTRMLKVGAIYRNPYDFGCYNNLRIFLGLTRNRSFWRHILLPSSHPPEGDGLTWTTIYQERNLEGILLL